MIIPVILAGGSGTRLWPISRSNFPKQFAPIIGEKTLFQSTLERAQKISEVASPIIICNREHLNLVQTQCAKSGIEPKQIILEPIGKNTAPAIAIAAMIALENSPENAEKILLVLPSDHIIADEDNLCAAIAVAHQYAAAGCLACFGIAPTAPETGYGYIKSGARLSTNDGYKIEKFVEKPAKNIAEQYLISGGYFWNSGMFMFRADRYLEELRLYAEDIYQAGKSTLQSSKISNNLVTLSEEKFLACRSDSIDYAVMEHTKNAVVIPLNAGWSDVGSWQTIWEQSPKDASGNVKLGDVATLDVNNSYIRATSRKVVAVGITDSIIIETPDVVVVVKKDECQKINQYQELIQPKLDS
ncbi:MAG: mannose-1-phosphate guanylyltransferase/mannose-6-phosphate isomerase [Gammaproteobacteria bacterium]|nr:mannose-1-phosphate guanylyltransferase/mannose-6-phosphate isomerase [Gammaproteobacteria bacterium]